MLYVIRHITTYTYRTEVAAARCTLHLQPVTAGNQRVFSANLVIAPKRLITELDARGPSERRPGRALG